VEGRHAEQGKPSSDFSVPVDPFGLVGAGQDDGAIAVDEKPGERSGALAEADIVGRNSSIQLEPRVALKLAGMQQTILGGGSIRGSLEKRP